MSSNNSRKRRSQTSSRDRWSFTNVSRNLKADDRTFNFVNRVGSPQLMDEGNLLGQNGKGFKNRLRRGSSRILSIFRISSSGSKTVNISKSDEAPGTSRLPTIDAGHQVPFLSLEQSSTSHAITNPGRYHNTQPSSMSTSDGEIESLAGLQNEPSKPRLERSKSSIYIRKPYSTSLRRSQSTPGLTHRLSHKLSSTFGNPTVVHRTSVRSRPSVQSIYQIAQDSDPAALIDQDQDSTNPSSYATTSSSSPQWVSTNPTTESQSPSPMRGSGPSSYIESNKLLLFPRINCRESSLDPIEEKPALSLPSIITVETTAIAKIFVETHFNNLLFKVKPRSQRRQDLENKLYSLKLSNEAKNKIRQAWAHQETQWLRQDRILKSRFSAPKSVKGVSIGGYEVVKILGKGSFGVVRLVKETNSTTPKRGSCQKSNSPAKLLSISDFTQLKASAKQFVMRSKDLTKLRKEVYAMKVIRKSDMLRNSQEGHLRAERDLLVASASQGSRWIVPLVASFQDNRNLYLVMDYCVGGDFLGLLIRKNILSETVTRWYVAEMVLCVEEAHRMKWIHRDVKPDNFLIDANGHLKISDFGLAFDGDWMHDQNYVNHHRSHLMDKLGIEVKGDEQDQAEAETLEASRNLARAVTGKEQLNNNTANGPSGNEKLLNWRNRVQRRKLAKSVVGTSQYMAPEVIRGELYDGRCDWWSIGIILYECLFGFTPFACENRQDTKLKILRHKTSLAFPPDKQSISDDAIDLILAILQEKEVRLCSRRYELNDYVQVSHYSSTPGYMGRGLPCGRANTVMPAYKNHRDYLGYFVYPDDAEDIKAHRFFHGIRWDQLHIRKPPFIPKIKDWDDTKYFDEDESVSDVESDSDSESEETAQVMSTKENQSLPPQDSHQPENQGIIPSRPLENVQNRDEKDIDDKSTVQVNEDFHVNISRPSNTYGGYSVCYPPSDPLHSPIAPPPTPRITDCITKEDTQLLSAKVPGSFPPAMPPLPAALPDPAESKLQQGSPKSSPRKGRADKKRARDKVLRDPGVGKTVMDIRKRGSFLGYDWKRPGNGLAGVLEEVVKEEEDRREIRLGVTKRAVSGASLCVPGARY